MTEILTRVMGVLQRVRDMSELSGAATVVFIVIFVLGLLNCILGYRILRFWMMLFGFGMGAGLGLVAAFLSGAEGKSSYFMAMLILGVILAAISFLIYRAGIFILGAGIGMSLGIYILHPTTSAMFFLCILIGVGLGCLAMRYAREVIIVGTSLLGGVMAGFSLGKLGGLANIPYGLAMSVGFVALGMLLQFVINKPEYEEEEDETEERRKRKPVRHMPEEFYDPYADDYDPYDDDLYEEEEAEREEDFLEKTQVYQPKRKSAKPERRCENGKRGKDKCNAYAGQKKDTV